MGSSSDSIAPLDVLNFNWGSAYEIWRQSMTWVAKRRDDGQVVTADGPEALRDAIIADYTKRPVPREPLPEQQSAPAKPARHLGAVPDQRRDS